MTTAGDLVYASGANALARLAIGANKTMLTSNGSAPSWSASPTVSGTLTAEAGLNVGSATGAATGEIKASVGLILNNISSYKCVMSAQTSQASDGASPKKISDTANAIALLVIISGNTGETALYALRGANGSQLLAPPAGGNWSATFDNAGTFNVYQAGADAKYYVQNKDTEGGASAFTCFLFGNSDGGIF